jgi:hypothetical protein
MLKLCTDMQVGLHVKGWLLTTIGKCQQTLVSPLNIIKFKENPSRESRFVTSGEKREANRHIFTAFNVHMSKTTCPSN